MVTCIPKTSCPHELSQMRNLSCTSLYSKVMEPCCRVLEEFKAKVIPKFNQFGGQAGSSRTYYLVEAWNNILESLDREAVITNLISIDFQKVFNSMDHGSCIEAFVRKVSECCPVSEHRLAIASSRCWSPHLSHPDSLRRRSQSTRSFQD